MATRQASEQRSDRIYEDLRTKIASGELAPRTRLPTERELAARYNSARNTVRKTMIRLVEEGLVDRHVGRGSFVSSSEEAHDHPKEGAFPLNELLEARLLLEPSVVDMVLERATDQDLSSLEAPLEKLKNAADWSAFKEAKYGLHLAIIRLAKNSFLVHVFENIIATRRSVAWQRSGPVLPLALAHEAAIAENVDIVAALRNRDAERAKKLITNHLLRTLVSLSEQ